MIVFLAWGVHPGAQAPERMGLGKDVLVSCRTRATLRDHCPLLFNTGLPERAAAREHERTSANTGSRLGKHS